MSPIIDANCKSSLTMKLGPSSSDGPYLWLLMHVWRLEIPKPCSLSKNNSLEGCTELSDSCYTDKGHWSNQPWKAHRGGQSPGKEANVECLTVHSAWRQHFVPDTDAGNTEHCQHRKFVTSLPSRIWSIIKEAQLYPQGWAQCPAHQEEALTPCNARPLTQSS